MTVKRRLRISNILMITVPAAMVIFINAAILIVVVWVMKIEDFRSLGSGRWAILGSLPPTIAVAAIMITNRFLTRFVITKITQPLEALSYGVHQIRDGNLDYRITYGGQDEFTAVCDDFNEMAWRLSELVAQQQREEENRKELIAGISHDLRTPLTSIKAYVEGLEKGVAATPEVQKKYVETIKRKSEELERIINQLFMFSKVDIGEFPFTWETVNLIDSVRGFVDGIFDEYAEKGLEVTFSAGADALYATVDVQQFRNAMMNVAQNSLKYKSKERGTLRIHCAPDGGNAVITLTDDGGGVPDKDVEKLFHIFFRGDASRRGESGSGLGLAIAAKMIERMGGGIRAQNTEPEGLAVIITLPAVGGETHEANSDY